MIIISLLDFLVFCSAQALEWHTILSNLITRIWTWSYGIRGGSFKTLDNHQWHVK